MKNEQNLKEVKVTHEIINFRCPAKLKTDFEWACGKDERTLSQQLRVLMAEYIAKMDDEIATPEIIQKAAMNHSDYVTTKFINSQKAKKRGR